MYCDLETQWQFPNAGKKKKEKKVVSLKDTKLPKPDFTHRLPGSFLLKDASSK